MKRAFNVLASLVFALAIVMSAGKSQAAVVQALFDGTDCTGFFGGGSAGACTIFIGEDENRIELSPVIAKFDNEDNFGLGLAELNTAQFPSIDGSEFSVTGQGLTVGTFTYNPEAGVDPNLNYWVVKAGSQFLLSWIVNAGNLTATCVEGIPDAPATNYNLACLQSAVPVTGTQDWETTIQQGISHITFYDTGVSPVPLPAAIWLFLSALGAFFGFRRWKASRSGAHA